MSKSNELTLEQEFKLVLYKKKIFQLNSQQVRQYLIIVLNQMLLKDNMIKYCIRTYNF